MDSGPNDALLIANDVLAVIWALGDAFEPEVTFPVRNAHSCLPLSIPIGIA